ncbi:MAG TPA: 50S ribosomal protein L25 [Patescibacteria group bacterium]|nr:50S ribosomal protein L25 [Patescibacteria group bacterium]
MAEFTLQVKQRAQAGEKLFLSRKQGLLPAVMYGHGTKPQMFWLQYLDFSTLYDKAGESSIVEIKEEKGKATSVIIHDVQRDPLSSRFTHVDLFQVRMDEKLETHIPLEFIGEAPAVREEGGILVKPIEAILVSCLPKDLPHSLTIDLSSLATLESHIQVKDIVVPHGVTILTDAETVLVLVETPRTEAEIAALDEKVEGDVTQVEGVVKEPAVVAEESDVAEQKASEEKPEKK